MGQHSIKKDKNFYFQIRDEELGLTRSEASDRMTTISQSRLQRIEHETTPIQPQDVIEMAEAYERPDLLNHYCSHDCPIGQISVTPVQNKDLSDIILNMLVSLNHLNQKKDLLMEITADGAISDDELKDFLEIQALMKKVSNTTETLNLWVQKRIAAGDIDEKRIKEIQSQLPQE